MPIIFRDHRKCITEYGNCEHSFNLPGVPPGVQCLILLQDEFELIINCTGMGKYMYIQMNNRTHSCLQNFLDLNECQNNICGIQAYCINRFGNYSCVCEGGYIGDPYHDCYSK